MVVPLEPVPDHLPRPLKCPERALPHLLRFAQNFERHVLQSNISWQEHRCRCVPARWHQCQSLTGQRRLVLAVSEVCVREYGAGRSGNRSKESENGIVGRSAAGSAAGVESGLCLSGRKRCSCDSENPWFRAACQVFLTGYGNAVLRCIVDFRRSISSVNSNHGGGAKRDLSTRPTIQ